jgi:hypothetical protein
VNFFLQREQRGSLEKETDRKSKHSGNTPTSISKSYLYVKLTFLAVLSTALFLTKKAFNSTPYLRTDPVLLILRGTDVFVEIDDLLVTVLPTENSFRLVHCVKVVCESSFNLGSGSFSVLRWARAL